MPTLLSADAAVEETKLPETTKRRKKFTLVKPFVLEEPEPEEPQKKKQKGPRPKIYSCTFEGCTAAFSRPCRLQEHMNIHEKNRPFVCTHCGKAFFRECHLKTHVKHVHDETSKIHSCTYEDCRKSFSTQQHLKRHMNTHIKLPMYMCTMYPPCTERFNKKGQLERHVRTLHLGLKGFVCRNMVKDANGETTECLESFETKGKRDWHIERVHRGMNMYFCEECLDPEMAEAEHGIEDEDRIEGMTQETIIVWPDDQIRSRSLRSTRNSNPNYTECQAIDDNDEFIKKEDNCIYGRFGGDSDHNTNFQELSDNTSVPTLSTGNTAQTTPGPSTIASTASKLGFNSYSALQAHMQKYHPPICRYCGKCCASNRDLRVHIEENHSAPLEERRLNNICPQCNKGFARKWGLMVHIKCVHAKEKNYACLFTGCSKIFGLKDSMLRHYERHHSQNVNKNGPELNNKDNKSRRGGLQKEQATLLTRLTGIGYENERSIACVSEGCEYRFRRRYDLGIHLQATHGFMREQVDEVLANMEGLEDPKDDDEEEDEDEMAQWDLSVENGMLVEPMVPRPLVNINTKHD